MTGLFFPQTCILQCLSECLGHLPVEMFDEITSGDCTDNQTVVRGVFVRSYLVGKGLQPIALLNSCIDSAFNIEWYVTLTQSHIDKSAADNLNNMFAHLLKLYLNKRTSIDDGKIINLPLITMFLKVVCSRGDRKHLYVGKG